MDKKNHYTYYCLQDVTQYTHTHKKKPARDASLCLQNLSSSLACHAHTGVASASGVGSGISRVMERKEEGEESRREERF